MIPSNATPREAAEIALKAAHAHRLLAWGTLQGTKITMPQYAARADKLIDDIYAICVACAERANKAVDNAANIA